MTNHFLLRLYGKLKGALRQPEDYAAVYNVNASDVSAYSKRALLLYLTRSFMFRGDDPVFLSHQNLKQCRQIASIIGEFGYIVDAANRRNLGPVRNKYYDLIICDAAHFRGIHKVSLRKGAIKIFLATSDNYITHNRNLRRRHDLLFKRRERNVELRRIYPEVMPYLMKSDVTIGFGNDYTMGSWKEVFGGPIYPFNNYGFEGTEFNLGGKDYSVARGNFLFFASRSQVQKGLDLLLEVFPRHPNLHIYVCSEFEKEGDFCDCYHKELYKTPNIHSMGWVTVNTPQYHELVKKCAYVIHPTCSEGQPGSVVQCMYSGLIPIVTKEAGIDTEDFGITFHNDSLEEIEGVIVKVSQLPERWCREHSIKTAKISREKYSENAFINRWRDIFTEILQ